MIWFRQMAQLSTTISHAHRATAFHWQCQRQLGPEQVVGRLSGRGTFLTSKRFLPSTLLSPSAAELPFFLASWPEPGASVMSTSAMAAEDSGACREVDRRLFEVGPRWRDWRQGPLLEIDVRAPRSTASTSVSQNLSHGHEGCECSTNQSRAYGARQIVSPSGENN